MNFAELKQNRLYHVLAHLALFFYLISAFPIAAMAADATTKIKHKPVSYYTSGKRISVQADISDKSGVNLARLYFKNNLQEDYLFVPMDPVEGRTYAGVIPAPAASAVSITYLFLVVNNENTVVKSQEFVFNIDDDKKTPAWQEVAADDQITLYSELPEMTQPPLGYTDSIAVDVVESGARFGVVVKGIYGSDKIAAAGVSGTASSATAGAAVVATSGLSALGIGAAVAAVAAGAAVASSSSSDDDSPSSTGTTTTSDTGGLTDVTVSNSSITLTLRDSAVVDDDQVDLTLNGSIVVSNHVLTGAGTAFPVTLSSGPNTLAIHADNQGTSGANTAELTISSVISGNSVQYWDLNTGETATMTISF